MLSGEQFVQLQEALLDAFPEPSDLHILARRFGERLSRIARDGDTEEITYDLIEWVEQERRLDDLVEAAFKMRPENEAMQAFAATYEAVRAAAPALPEGARGSAMKSDLGGLRGAPSRAEVANQTTIIQGPVYGLVQGSNNNVTLVLGDGQRRDVPFLAPPRPPHRLVGREELLDDVTRALLPAEQAGPIALLGLPGSGKTALAVEVAHRTKILERFDDGVLWAGLGQAPNPLVLLASWGGVLQIPTNAVGGASLSDWARTIRAAIGTRRMLLVLDDAWDVQAVQALLVGGPGCAHLVTTRVPEVALRLSGDRHYVVPELDLSQGLELLGELAPEVTKAEPEDARELVRSVGALPLALILMGNHLRLESYGGQSRRVQAALARLGDATERLLVDQPQSPVDPHPSVPLELSISMLAVIGVSVDRLSVEVRNSLYDLTVFPPKPNSFAEDAALAVMRSAGDRLDHLVDAGLLEIMASTRYTMHQTIRDYAGAQISTLGSRPRMVEFFTSYVAGHREDHQVLDAELTNVLAAADIAEEIGDHRAVIELVDGIQPFLRRRAMYAVAEPYLRMALAAAGQLDDAEVETRLLLALGKALEKQGRIEDAERSLRQGLELAHGSGRRGDQIDLLVALGWVEGMRGDSETASLYLQEARTLVQPVPEDDRAPMVLQAIGWLTGLRGEYADAVDHLRQALALERQHAKPELLTDLLQVLGWMSAMGGQYEQAESAFTECLALGQSSGDRDRMIDAHQGLGWIAGVRADYRSAAEQFEKGLTLAREVGHRERVSLLANLGWIAREQGQYDRADDYLREGLSLAREFGQLEKQSALLKNLGDLERSRADDASAEQLYREALDAARAGRFEEREVDALGGLVGVARAGGRLEDADALLAEALGLARKSDNDVVLSGLLNELGDVALARGQLAEAQASFDEAKRRADSARSQNLQALSLFGLARCAGARGEVDEAARLARASEELFAAIGNRMADEVRGWIARSSPGGAGA